MSAVIDPGARRRRRPILELRAGNCLSHPTTGSYQLVFQREEHIVVRRVAASHYFLPNVSATFQGRDIFAPVAA